MNIPPDEFAEACVSTGILFGVSPHYLMAAAQARSGIDDAARSAGTGPYDVTQAMFDADSAAPDLHEILGPGDIDGWPSQVTYAAISARRHQNELIERLGGMPSALQLFQAQWPDPSQPPRVSEGDLDEALAKSAPYVGKALGREFGMDPPQAGTIVGATSPVPTPVNDPRLPTPDGARELFRSKAPWVMRRLLHDFPGLDEVAAAAVLGNIGHECAGFRVLQEVRPRGGGPGGFGWCQWTGDRRTAFMSMCVVQGLAPTSDVANYEFLRRELTGGFNVAVAALRRDMSLADAVRAFERAFEKAAPDAKHYDRRTEWAVVALDAYHAAQRSPEQALPDAVRDLLDVDCDFLAVRHAAQDGIDYWLVDEFADGGGQVLIKQAVHAKPEVLVRDSAVFPLSPSTAASPQVGGIPASIVRALSQDAVPAPSLRPGQARDVARAAALVLASAKSCDETLITRAVPGTSNGRRACAWAVNKVVEAALGTPVGGGLSTNVMAEMLARSAHEVDAESFLGGAIVISATAGGRVGHVGVMGEPAADRDQTTIYSNSSSRGVFSHLFNLARWKAYYGGRLGLRVRFYQL